MDRGFRKEIFMKTAASNRLPTSIVSGLSWTFATFFGIGYLRPGPGTYASGITVVLWWTTGRFLGSRWGVVTQILACLAVTALGIPASWRVSREAGCRDPGFVVIDEVAGQCVALTGLPLDWK